MDNKKLTHGLLSEDFKQNILNIVNQHSLDVQTKAIIMESVAIQLQIAAKSQTDKELQEYKDSLEPDKRMKNKNNDEEETSN